MKETRADNLQSFVLALLLHLLLFGLVFIGLQWTRRNAEPAGGGPPVEAEMVDAGSLSAKMQDALASRIAAPTPVEEVTPEPALPDALEEVVEPSPPQPLPEPDPQDATTPPQPAPETPQAKPDTRDQDEARRDALSKETREREQEALRRERQVELQKQQQQAAEEKQRLAAQQKADADAKAKQDAEAKKKRAAALAAQREQQLADAKARAGAATASNPGPASGAGQGKDTRAEWLALIAGEIERQWRRPDDIPRGQKCPIRIKLLPGGEVLSAEVQPGCPYSEANQRTVEAAVKKASPLPLKGNEDLRLRDFVVNFYPSR